jgi:hypothetical protein
MDRGLRINAPAVVAEIIDGEAVIMDLASGHYFSTQGVGADIWRGVEEGHSAVEIVHSILSRYEAPRDVVEPAVHAFVAELLSRALIVRVPEPRVVADNGSGMGVPGNGSAAHLQFVAPVLTAYTDMEELLLLDPIHDVDETGWPMPKSDDADA